MALNYEFDADVTVPDDTPIAAGQTFTKTWRVKNTGTEPWTGFQLSHVADRAMTTNVTVPVPDCQPGQKAEISVILTAPDNLGLHLSTWRFRDGTGELWGDPLYTRIKVVPAAVQPTPQPVAPPTDQPVPVPAVPAQSDLLYIDDVTIEDNAKLAAGSRFVKTWRVKNTGTTSWGDDFTLRHNDGTAMTVQTSVPLPACAPGQEVEVSLELRTPATPGKYYTEWLAHDPQGEPFGEILWMPIFSVTPSGLIPTQPTKPTQPTVTINTKAPHFSQRDPQWRRERLGHPGSGETIGSWGCQITCFAMLAGALGHQITPPNLNSSMIRQGGFVNVNNTRWNALSTVFSDIQFAGKEDMNPQMVTRIDTWLANGVPVPVQVDRTPRTRYNSSDQHWVLVVARNGNNDFWMYDPADLEPEAKSLMGKYGRPHSTLRTSVLAAIFYRKS
ncbi:MAG: C39 family peptidase [Anaerolineae bacterium]|nr:C39 family peptidase [Anaerolineae bacterium]